MKEDEFDSEDDPLIIDGYPDDELFVFDDDIEEEREPSTFDRIKPYIVAFVAFLAILGLLNLSGLYQTFRFFETPSGVLEEAADPPAALEQISVPIVFYIVRGANGSERTDADIDQLMRNGQRIWDQANIELEQTAVYERTLSEEQSELFFRDPDAFAALLKTHKEKGITVVLVRSLRGINGLAYPSLDMIGVADLTTIFDFRVFAHEIGHVFSLSHTDDRDLLMHREANSIELMRKEITKARQAANTLSHEEID